MNNRNLRIFLLLTGLFVLVGVLLIRMPVAVDADGPAPLVAQVNAGQAFSYQGYLNEDERPFNGTCRFTFSLFDRFQGGNQIGETQEIRDVEVIEGSFAVMLNGGNEFGDDAFNGQARWLEVTVDCGRGATTLDARQELTAVPYAFSLRPGATISGNVPVERGVINLDGGYYGLSILSAENDGIHIESAGDDGLDVSYAADTGVYARGGGLGGYLAGTQAGLLATATTENSPDLVLGGWTNGEGVPIVNGRITTYPDAEHADMHLWSNRSVTVRLDFDANSINPNDGTGTGAFIVTEGIENPNNNVTHMTVNHEGIEGERFFVTGEYGSLTTVQERAYFDASTDGVYALTENGTDPDLILGGTGNGVTDDDGMISSDPDFESSDIVLRSYDTVRVDLNVDGDAEVGSFEVRDHNSNLLFIVETNGDVCIGNCSR